MGMFEVVNQRYEGGLAAHLRQLRADGFSIDEIVAAFEFDGIKVSAETVRRWCHKAGIPTHRVPAS